MTDQTVSDDRVVVWFDIDNTLYSASSKIAHAMGERIHNYFVKLGLSHEDAHELHKRYYSEYGLALRGLARHHDIDPLDFDRQCDGSLPLEDMIQYNPSLRKLFEDIDRSKARVWTLTNAYRNHAQRVLRILQLDDLIDGLIYCNYEVKDFSCKPEAAYYQQAMRTARLTDPSKCYFVDDSRINIDGARAQGWSHCVHFCETGIETIEGGVLMTINAEKRTEDGIEIISNLEELRRVWSGIFRQSV